MVIYFVGTPGTGKTTIAREVAESCGFEFLEINELVEKFSFYIGYDVFRDSLIIDEPLLTNHIENLLTGNPQVCLSGPVLNIPSKLINLVVLLRCDSGVLRKRLESRGYSEEKIMENLEAELLEVIAEETRQLFLNKCQIIELDTSTSSSMVLSQKILDIIEDIY